MTVPIHAPQRRCPRIKPAITGRQDAEHKDDQEGAERRRGQDRTERPLPFRLLLLGIARAL